MEYKRLTATSEITDSATLIALCESCGESGCDDNCGEYQDNNCVGCPVQESFARLAAYEDTGLSPVETQELAKAKAEDRLVILSCKRGDRIYNIRQAWDSKARKYVNKIRCTRFECYSIYPEDPIRIYYKCAASSSWIDINNLYLTREEAKKALNTGGDTECQSKL